MEDPSVSIEIGGIVWLLLHGDAAHLRRPLEFLALQGQIIGVVVQHRGIFGIDLQCLLISGKGLFLVVELVIGITDRGERLDHYVGIVLESLRHACTLGDDRLKVVLVVIGHDAHVQERGLVREGGIRLLGGLEQGIPVLAVAERLDVHRPRIEIPGIQVTVGLEQLHAPVTAVRTEEIRAYGKEHGGVRRMGLHSVVEEGIQLWLEILEEPCIEELRKVGKVLTLGLGGNGGTGDELFERVEEAVERTVHPVHLRLAQERRGIAGIEGEGLVIIGHGQRILVCGRLGVPHHGKHLRRGEILVELLQHRESLRGLVLMHEYVVPRKCGGLIASHNPLDLIKGLKDLVETVLPDIKVHERIVDISLAGEVGKQRLVCGHRLVVLAVHGIKRGQAVPVPVIAGSEADGFAYLFKSGSDIPETGMAHALVKMGGIVVGESLENGGEAVHGSLCRTAVISLDGIHQQRLGSIPEAGSAVLSPECWG